MLISSLGIVVIFVSLLNIVRMAFFLIGSDIYSIKHHFRRKRRTGKLPKVSVVIPAFNESKTILHTISSVLASDYPSKLLEIIVIDDGSTDNTSQLVSEYIANNNIKNLHFISKLNGGKASAMNTGLQNLASGELIMCLDADAYVHKFAIRNGVRYFEDEKIVGLASNVKVERTEGIINLIQVFEYLVGYQMKKALTQYNIEYIIGGVGSFFRKTILEDVKYYDSDTITEDIDLTMKILQKGNKNVRVIYASDVVTYTQSATSISDLIKQRFRWKWGRYQTFYKNKSIFFTLRKGFTKGLTWYYLPYVLLSDILLFLEPLMLLYVLLSVIFQKDYFTLYIAVMVMSFYLSMNVIAEETVSFKGKLKLLMITPFMYFFLYILSYVEYAALIKSFIRMPGLKGSIKEGGGSWQPVNRVRFNRS